MLLSLLRDRSKLIDHWRLIDAFIPESDTPLIPQLELTAEAAATSRLPEQPIPSPLPPLEEEAAGVVTDLAAVRATGLTYIFQSNEKDASKSADEQTASKQLNLAMAITAYTAGIDAARNYSKETSGGEKGEKDHIATPKGRRELADLYMARAAAQMVLLNAGHATIDALRAVFLVPSEARFYAEAATALLSLRQLDLLPLVFDAMYEHTVERKPSGHRENQKKLDDLANLYHSQTTPTYDEKLVGALQQGFGMTNVNGSNPVRAKALKALQASGYNYNRRDENKRTCLHAIICNSTDDVTPKQINTTLDTLRSAMELGADPFAGDVWGSNALHCAGLLASNYNGNLDICRTLLKHAEGMKKKSAAAAAEGGAENAAVVVGGEKELVNSTDYCGKSVIHMIAGSAGHPAVLKFFLDKGASVTATDYAGNTPLHYCGTSSAIKTMLAKNVGGLAVLEAKNVDGQTPFLKACADGRNEAALALAQAGANAKAIDKYGNTANHLAIPRCSDQNNIYLFKAFGFPELKSVVNCFNQSIAHIAAKSGRENLYGTAIDPKFIGCSTTEKDVYGMTPLMYKQNFKMLYEDTGAGMQPLTERMRM